MGLVINYTYDSSVTNLNLVGNAAYDPTLYAQYTSATQAAIDYFDSVITNPITVNISFGWGEAGGSAIGAGASGQSGSYYNTYSYAELLAALRGADTTSAVQLAAMNTLTDASPSGESLYRVNYAEAKALGLLPAATSLDGSVGLDATGTTWTWPGMGYPTGNNEDAVGTLEHEISEVLGRSATGGAASGTLPVDYRPLDLFRYTAADGQGTDAIGAAAGVRDEPFAAGYNPQAPSYFSYDGTGVTLLYETPANVAGGADVADWAPSVAGDSFADGGNGAPTPVSTTDLQELNVLGYALACFLPDTRIATPAGEVAVQTLVAGDLVLTQRGEAKPITWIGHGKALATRGRRNAATPVTVRKGALADNVPNRDLHITKGHSLYIDGVLIPVEFLVNHRSVVWNDHAREVEVYHVELGAHDVLLANGAPAESYREDGNRWLFQNLASFNEAGGQVPCAPVLTGGPVVDAIWRRVLERSGQRPNLPLTDDPDLHLLADGQRLEAQRTPDGSHAFRLPAPAAAVRIVSRAGAQDELGLSRDPRALGVGLCRIVLWRGWHPTVVEACDASLCDGFHEHEAENGLRWTDGDAALPASLLGGVTAVQLYTAGSTRYPLFTNDVLAAA